MSRKNTTLAMALLLSLMGCGSSESENAVAAPSQAAEAAPNQAANAAAQAPSEAAEAATVGAPAPDFTLPDQDGAQHSLAQYRGKIVVLEWINPRCPYVQRHYAAGTMTRLDGELPDDDVVWLAIDSSNFVLPEQSRAWRAEHSITYPILQDPSGDVGRRYAARTTPHMYVIDRDGTLRYAGAIDDDPRGQSESPTNHVALAVRALLAGEAPPTSSTDPYGCTVKYEGS